MRSPTSLFEPATTLPSALAAEQALLGGLLQDSRRFDQIADRVSVEDFYHPQHRLIFEAIAELVEANRPCDLITVSERLKARDLLEKAGGHDYLVALVEEIPPAPNLQAYADLIREKAILRSLIEVGGEIATLGYRPEGRGFPELLELAEQKVFKIADSRRQSAAKTRPLREVLKATLASIEERYRRGSGITGIPTGFYGLDERLAGLQRGDLVLIAGRPSMGKTSFALNIAHHVSLHEGLPVLFFSLEMPAEQIAMRLLSQIARIDQLALRTGQIADADWPRLLSGFNQLVKARLFIDDTSQLSPTEMRARARRLVREQGELGLIVIDYLQLMHAGDDGERRVEEIGRISRGLKMLAKELSVPVIALSQLNRNVEQRQDKRPVLSDLRESGSLEQDADVILFIYRDEVYRRQEERAGGKGEDGIAEVIIGKQRNGPIGTVKLKFLAPYTSFENLEERLDDDDVAVPTG